MNRVAKRYSKAIFELALEKDLLDKIEQDFVFLENLLTESEEMPQYLANPLITENKKIEMLAGVVGKKVSEVTFNFLQLLASRRRLRILPAILENFRLMMLEHRNIVEGELISAVELEEKQVNAIKQHLENMLGKNVQLSTKIKPDILGGFVVRVQDVVIDNSIRLQLSKLREKLMAR